MIYLMRRTFHIRKKEEFCVKILVAGAGHGGLTAAALLAADGYDVTVLEKDAPDTAGLDQTDAFDAQAFEYAGIPVPQDFTRGANRLTFIPLENGVEPLTLPRSKEESIIVNRKKLLRYLTDFAVCSGVKIEYGVEVTGAIMLGSRVAGVKTQQGDMYADLIIDACGVHSPVRCSLPQFTSVDRPIHTYDLLHTYRAAFKKNEEAEQPDTYYNIYLREDGTVGLSWVITGSSDVDILVARFPQITDADVLKTLVELHGENPQMDTQIISTNKYRDIPVCQPLAVLVADGYAAVGDSAFMTYPVKGSGIAYSVKAGKMLADTVKADINGFFTAETLWGYQKRFFEEIGDNACRLALIKNLLPYMTAAEVNEIFKDKLVTGEELERIMTDRLEAVLNAAAIPIIREKIKLVRNNAALKEKLLDLAVWLGKFTLIAPTMPSHYDREDAARWAQRYNEFFDSVRKSE